MPIALEPIGDIPPADAVANYPAALEPIKMQRKAHATRRPANPVRFIRACVT
ncbi:hypothetical protein [Phreatobacter sp.]|uniref:hypothetical protein n=1 Tax=Phreatobacter sp. TaxID=1966341 RepID=UPI0025E46440|nr:hypothetical protein [Phreatobacter sp.]